jgi:hypothetical protein
MIDLLAGYYPHPAGRRINFETGKPRHVGIYISGTFFAPSRAEDPADIMKPKNLRNDRVLQTYFSRQGWKKDVFDKKILK